MAAHHHKSLLLVRSSSSTILPATPTPFPPPLLPLSSFDLLLRHVQYNQRILLYNTSHIHAPFSSLVQHLKASLSHTLPHFYPLAGRLLLSPDGRLHILCNDAGAEFIEAYADVSLAQMLDCQKPPIFFDLAPRKDAMNMDGFHLPLLIVQITQLRDDGMAIGLTINHMAVDGNSTWHFINSWAEICRGKDSISVKPIYDRSLIEEAIEDLPVLSESESQVKTLPFCSPKPLHETVFYFSGERVAELKDEANRYRPKGSKPFSSYQALTAYLWKCITKARDVKGEEVTCHKLSVDCRRRLRPALPGAYFGNAINSVVVRSRVEEVLAEGSIGEMARLLQEAIEGYSDEAIRESLKKGRGESLRLGGLENVVHVGSSFRFAAYESDFGWGKPVGVRSGRCNKADGKITLFPGVEGEGSVEAEISLYEESMAKLEALLVPEV